MRAEDFSVWLSAISGMSAAQRSEALAALEQAAADAGPTTKTRGKRTEDALGTTGVERVARQGCPHCAGREIVGWGRSDRLLRFRCKSCGRTFNALTKTPMALRIIRSCAGSWWNRQTRFGPATTLRS